MGFLRRVWSRVASLWRPTPCERCGSPSVGFFAETVRSHGTDPQGRPVTTFRARSVAALCRGCMAKAWEDRE